MAETRVLYYAKGGKLLQREVPVRQLKPTQVRVKVHAAGVNPVDWKTTQGKLAEGTGQGNDFAGVVVEVGSDVKNTKVGDTVAGGIAGGDVDDPENGAFTPLLAVEEHLLFKFPYTLKPAGTAEIPVGLPKTFEQAASLGLVWDTALLAFDGIKPGPDDWAVIYGGTGGLGFAAAQFARNIGFKVIVVSSPAQKVYEGQHFEFLDRNDPLWPSKARGISNDQIVFGFDTIDIDRSTEEVFHALTATKHANLVVASAFRELPRELHVNKPKVRFFSTLYFLLVQRVKKFGPRTFTNDGKNYFQRAPELISSINRQISEGKVQSLPIQVFNGFDKVNEAVESQRRGVRAKKIVVKFA